MEEQKVYHINGKYQIQFERSAVKGADGFKVTVNSDSASEVLSEANQLYQQAIEITKQQEIK